MLVTVFADASFCPDTRAAGWGGWAKSERGTTRGGGLLTRVLSADRAESGAILAAISMSIVDEIALRGDSLLIQSDCQTALRRLGWSADGARRRPQCDQFSHTMSEYELHWTLRWVRGHQSRDRAPRYAVNNYCDEEAGRHMRAERERLRGTR